MNAARTSESVYVTSFAGTAPENYERYFVPVIGGPLARDLVDLADLRAGERVLDVACGTGIVARLAAERVAPTGSVAGADINPGMLAVARTAAAGAALPIRWFETTAEAMPLPDSAFDVLLCQLGLMFIPDKPAALGQMRRVLASGGRTYITVPRPSAFFDVLDEAIGRHVGPEAAAFVRMVFSLNEPAELERLVRTAAWESVDVRMTTKQINLPAPEEFLWQYISCTPLAATVAGLDDRRRTALEEDVVSRWQRWTKGDGMTYAQEMLIATARN
jgi:ubiquinone/menaquinone biosynthesis C-methylase UbiE